MERTVLADRLAARLAPGLSATVAQALLASPRLGARTRDWALSGQDALDALSDTDRMIADRDPGGVKQLAALAGAVWHARRVRSLILAADVQAFLAAHGPEARLAALRLGDLAPLAVTDELPLVEAVGADGRACLSAWIDALPPEAASIVRLSLDPADEGAPAEAHRLHGPGILRAVAAP